MSEEFLLSHEKSNDSDYCINRCASHPRCYHAVYKHERCSLYNINFENAKNKEVCANTNKEKCININSNIHAPKILNLS